jgi:hypothetical protein
MPSLRNPDDRAALVDRIGRLTADSERRWGTMNAQQMVCHVADQMRVALGDVDCRDRSSLMSRTLLKWIVIYLRPPVPKGKIRTVKEMLRTPPAELEADRAALIELIDRLADATELAPHPVFGRLGPRQWGTLAAIHLDHHLRQFGV